MNAAEQRALAERIQRAMDGAGIEVVTAVREGGNLVGYAAVPAPTLLGCLMRNGWVVRDVVPRNTIDRAVDQIGTQLRARVLHLHTDGETTPRG